VRGASRNGTPHPFPRLPPQSSAALFTRVYAKGRLLSTLSTSTSVRATNLLRGRVHYHFRGRAFVGGASTEIDRGQREGCAWLSDNAAAGRVDRSFRTQCGRCGGTGRRADLRRGAKSGRLAESNSPQKWTAYDTAGSKVGDGSQSVEGVSVVAPPPRGYDPEASSPAVNARFAQPCRHRPFPPQAGGPHRRARWETLRHTVNEHGATGRALILG
jgi:hypothetical protein